MIRWVLIACCLFGCSKKEESSLDQWMGQDERVRVLSTTAMVGDLVEQIGGEHIAHEVLIRGAMDPHSYELVKGDDEKLQRADLVFASGLGLEHGASLKYALNERAIEVTDRIAKEKLLEIGGVVDPHIWMDVSLWKETVDPIVEALSKCDPAHASLFVKNGESVKEQMDLLDQTVFEKMQAVPSEKRYLVTSHDAFNYFARRYLACEGEWEERFKAPEGLAPDGQLGLGDLQEILDHIAKYKIRFLFTESNVSVDSLMKIHSVAKQKGLTVHFAKSPLYGDSMEGEEGSVANYREMVEHNANVISSFLGAE